MDSVVCVVCTMYAHVANAHFLYHHCVCHFLCGLYVDILYVHVY